MKKFIDPFEYAGVICKATKKGILLTTKAGAKVNTMTIGWGTLGNQWHKPIYTVFVRQSRHTKKLLDENGEFTVNVPLDDSAKKILGVCGTASGRDINKIEHLGLTLEEPEIISVPGIKELPLTLECKVIYKQDQVLRAINDENRLRYYEPGTKDEQDFHTAYYGQVVAAYIIE
jgi:flavin reductase (DIM6/NTAB) family NADH-FMN oxidoreductase RutF